MKILICGKGGSGKSTIASLLAKDIETKGYRVLVVDADESNFGLSALLGLEKPKELMDQLGGKKTVVDKMWAGRAAGEKAAIFTESWSIDEIPIECVSNRGNLYLLQIGKVKHFGEGCACPMGGLSRDFLNRLKLGPKDVAVIDTEAGVEHLGRGVASGVDVILMVLDPSYESIRLSEKISAMAKEAHKSVRFVLNKMDKATADKISAKIGKENIVGFVPFSTSIQEKGLSGEELDTATSDIGDVTSFVLNALQVGSTC
jgi:CO dehydrogenase maturation factor